MIRGIVCLSVLAFMSSPTLRQAGEKPAAFEIADVHLSPPTGNSLNRFRRGPFTSGGRYEVRTATVLDLILLAYSPAGSQPLDADKVAGGPDWLEFDRFDVAAKAPSRSSVESMKSMLQTLLADRFKLVIHKDTGHFRHMRSQWERNRC
jgi:uncharacterized protein (TIGR03435 family)